MDAEKIVRQVMNENVPMRNDTAATAAYRNPRLTAAIATALRSAYAEGYAAAREQAAMAVEEVKRIYVDASNANSAGPLLEEAATAIRSLEPEDVT